MKFYFSLSNSGLLVFISHEKKIVLSMIYQHGLMSNQLEVLIFFKELEVLILNSNKNNI